ncbi:hypothetical protein MYX75_03870 [Acidobacteria bacterium AH-259-A15]|nr:hypothetical protein [Acidobacteria bacterium AH-259-A15]
MRFLCTVLTFAIICLPTKLRAQPVSQIERVPTRGQIERQLTLVLGELSSDDIQSAWNDALRRPIDRERLQRAIARSRPNVKTIFSADISYSATFLITLDYDRDAFDSLLQGTRRKRVTLPVFNGALDASADLEMKARVVRESGKDQVNVKVHTLDDQGQGVHNCKVWYVPYLKDDDQHKIKFDRLSTPTTDFIPPGKWKIWSERGGKEGVKTPFLCGDDGRDNREIDIPAP